MNKKEVRRMSMLRDNISKMPLNKYYYRMNMLYLFDELMKEFGYTYSDGGYSKRRADDPDKEEN